VTHSLLESDATLANGEVRSFDASSSALWIVLSWEPPLAAPWGLAPEAVLGSTAAICSRCVSDAVFVSLAANTTKASTTIAQVVSDANLSSLTSTSSTGLNRPRAARLGAAMAALDDRTSGLAQAREELLAELRAHALVIGEVTLTSGATAKYYVDAKRAILLPRGFAALSRLLAHEVSRLGGTAVGGMTMGADPLACAALAGGAQAKAFFVRKDSKAHGLQRRIEGPWLEPEDRCVVVEDVVTTGGSTLAAIAALQEAGHEVCGVVSVLDRLAGGGPAIEAAAGAPYVPLTTIDELYPDRPDRATA
jgi:orotate phosphoribosyltransferase